MNAKELIRKIDPTLELKKKFQHGSSLVYHVASGDQEYVLKVAEKIDYLDNFMFLNKEIEALEDLHDFDGVTHLIEKYPGVVHEGGEYHSILKEYFPGKESTFDGGFALTSLRDDLKGIIQGLHERGYAGLDINHEEIIISPEADSLKIIDMDQYVHREDRGKLGFFAAKKVDWFLYSTLF